MATSGNRPHRNPRNRKRPVRPHNGSSGVARGFAPDEMLAVYNATLDATLELLNTALSTASRFQQLQAERGQQALSLAGRAVSVLSRADRDDLFTAQSDLTQEAMYETRVYWQQMLALSGDARRELLLVLDRQWRLNGMPPAWSLGADEDAEH